VRVQIYDAVERIYAPVESGDRSGKLPGDWISEFRLLRPQPHAQPMIADK